ncbi:MAG TPA: hypothetical protein DCO93_05455 [Clostridiales bacterium]|nr:hypothetical protein [Clostridiales bacterium]
MSFFKEIFLDSFFDAAKLLPLLFLIYLIVEYLEHKNNNFVHNMFRKSKKTGPFLGAVFGTVPQCGFSVIASELFSKKAITLGTLIAIFIATSDEAIPILIAHPDKLNRMLALIGIKFIAAVIFGFLIDFIVKTTVEIDEKNDGEHHFHGNCESCEDGILKSAVIHSVKIFVFIFLVNIILGIVTEFVSPLMQFITYHSILQLVLSCLFGIIPNCAASVVLTELYIAGKIGFASLAGGLCTGAGVGLMVLFKQNKNQKQNFTILLTILVIGIITGLILKALGI